MNFLQHFHPRRFMQMLDEIDQQMPSWQMDKQTALRRVMITLLCVCLSLLILHYGKFSSNFQALLGDEVAQGLADSGWYELAAYGWWSGMHLLTFIILPFITIRFIFREKIINYGWRMNDTLKHWPGYVLLITPILFFIFLVSQGEDFVNHYPFYTLAGRSFFDLLLWQLLYISQFIFLEFFFRGFILQALRPALGANAIWIMCVPYLMIHFPKLWLEATGAILFGFFLGILALRSRSIWGGVMVHVGIALTMDIAALLRKGEFPVDWWPGNF
jgi:membrane protease YdiL (CAAX protease family)